MQMITNTVEYCCSLDKLLKISLDALFQCDSDQFQICFFNELYTPL